MKTLTRFLSEGRWVRNRYGVTSPDNTHKRNLALNFDSWLRQYSETNNSVTPQIINTIFWKTIDSLRESETRVGAVGLKYPKAIQDTIAIAEYVVQEMLYTKVDSLERMDNHQWRIVMDVGDDIIVRVDTGKREPVTVV